MKKINKLYLTSFGLETEVNPDSFVLGEWCKDDKIHPNNYSLNVLPFHWDEREKLKEDYDKIEILHDRILDSLTNSLNKLHNTSYSKRYWQIILDPWLMDYISIMFDRWETIRIVSENIKNLSIDFYEINNEDFFPVENMQDLHGFFNLNETNQFFYQKIIKEFFNEKFEIHKKNTSITLNMNEEYPTIRSLGLSLSKYLKVSLGQLFDNLLSQFSKNNNYIFIDSYFRLFQFIKLNLILLQIPRMYVKEFELTKIQKKKINESLNKEKRNLFFLDFNPENLFEVYLKKNIKKHLPSHLIETYDPIIREISKIKISGNIIISANSHWSNTMKKIWIAEKVNNNAIFITLEHGGSFPAYKENFQFEENISNKRATWTKSWHKKHIQLPPSKLVHFSKKIKSNIKVKNNNSSLLLMYGGRRWSFRINFYPQSYQTTKILDDAISFYNNLNLEIKRSIKFKFHHDIGLNEKNKFSNSIKTKIQFSSGDYYKSISNSKLIICTYPETTFAEAMASNNPTIMFYNKKFFERNPMFHDLIGDLVRANIIFFNAEDASKHLNNIWHDIDSWWKSETVLEARLKFRRNASKIDIYWSSKWSRFLSDFRPKKSKLNLIEKLTLYFISLRRILLTITSPLQVYREIKSDLIKDKQKDFKSTKNKVWCAGLPHSGSTLMEEIFELLPYVRLDQSFLRYFSKFNITHLHGISNESFLCFPNDKFSFLKTHSHFEQEFIEFAKDCNITVIVCLRDLRDMMLSRYWHIMSNKNHQAHLIVRDLPFKEGFIKTLLLPNEENFYSDKPINDYFLWIKNWLIEEKKGNIKLFWYEDYIRDPIKYLDDIKEFIEFKNIDSSFLEEKLEEKRIGYMQTPLEKRLFNKSRSKSTYRSGRVGEWKKYFDDDIIKIINNNIDGKIEEITRN